VGGDAHEEAAVIAKRVIPKESAGPGDVPGLFYFVEKTLEKPQTFFKNPLTFSITWYIIISSRARGTPP
jgi:hypothetical protein